MHSSWSVLGQVDNAGQLRLFWDPDILASRVRASAQSPGHMVTEHTCQAKGEETSSNDAHQVLQDVAVLGRCQRCSLPSQVLRLVLWARMLVEQLQAQHSGQLGAADTMCKAVAQTKMPHFLARPAHMGSCVCMCSACYQDVQGTARHQHRLRVAACMHAHITAGFSIDRPAIQTACLVASHMLHSSGMV